MWPILGPIEYNQIHRSINFPTFQQHTFFNPVKFHPDHFKTKIPRSVNPTFKYFDPISSTCLIIYSLVLLLLCALPILALNVYLRQALTTFQQTNQLHIHR
ncbi:unnamed protein product [Adineta ricciae]|uniref:Uncharacterized protein n=1 Tax=Adineta ricciae TaxID=249248 RepID=A0A815ZEU2_ADIRI|nr:unnamed protein product [Adineta ricciae]